MGENFNKFEQFLEELLLKTNYDNKKKLCCKNVYKQKFCQSIFEILLQYTGNICFF